MQTGNTQLLDKKANKEYYEKSDQNFMPLEQATMAHKVIPRIQWLVGWVHKLDSRTHIGVGVKDGYECLTLQAMGVDCVGVDPSQDSIDEARFKAFQLGFDATNMFVVGTGEELPDDLRADSVSCLEVIEHVVDPHKLLKKLSKVGGHVLISTPDANGRHGIEDAKRNPEHVRLYTQEELTKLISKYGTIIDNQIIDDQLSICFKPK